MSRRKPTPVNIRNFSVRCGQCGDYPVLAAYEPSDEHNIYRFECDESSGPCAPIFLEIPIELDEFGNRDPDWHGGKKHAGADAHDGEPEAAEAVPAETTPAQPASLLPVVSD